MSASESSAPVAYPAGERDWLAKLISFDTTSSKTNVPLIQYVANYMTEALAPEKDGAVSGKVLIDWSSKRNGVMYANLVVTIPATASAGSADGAAPVVTGGLMLSGHSDVVPVEGQDWNSDPFAMVERDGKLYGRGACDMKGFLAVCLSLVPEWSAAMRAGRLRRPIHFVLTYSEETDFGGILQLVQPGSEAWQRVRDCEGCVIGEPTLMELVVAHKGIHEGHITCHGTASHASQVDKGYNALEPAANVLRGIFELQRQYQREGPHDEDYEISYTAIYASQVNGGQALNTTPDKCVIGYQFRNLPIHNPKTIARQLQAIVEQENAAARAAAEALNNAVVAKREAGGVDTAAGPITASVEMDDMFSTPHFLADAKATVVTTLQRIVTSDAAAAESHVGAHLQKISISTEAGVFEENGMRTVVCGPGSIDQAHRANEFVSIAQMEMCVRVMRKMVETMCFEHASA